MTQQLTDIFENVSCNLCGKDDYDIIYPAAHTDLDPEQLLKIFRSSGDDVLREQLVRCRSCGLLYLNPRLHAKIIMDGYSRGADEVFVSQADARERTFRRSWKILKKFHPNPGKILDIGTASGAFLKVAKDNGWDAQGCEPNRWMSDWCEQHYGIKVFPGTVFDMQVNDKAFDAVSLWDVLEHTTDPKAVLKECGRILKPGGFLLVNYPDIESAIARAMGRKWVFLLSIHLYYFTPKTIKTLLREAGFQTLLIRPHWQSLELDYILRRMSAYMPRLAGFGQKLTLRMGLSRLNIPYWMGQTFVLARKT